MRFINKTVALILTIVMLVVMLAVPTSAYVDMAPTWKNYMKSFAEICKNVDRDQYYSYIMALQRYLMCFDYECKDKLYYNGGYMDGDFGGRTESAVIYLQEQLGFTGVDVDGVVGENTWGAIANTLKQYPENYNRMRRPQGIPGQWAFGLGVNEGGEYFCYVTEDNSNLLPV